MTIPTYEKIYARKCVLVDLSSVRKRPIVKQFLNDNHLQGWARGLKVVFGLYVNDGAEQKLVQLMAFGKPRFNRHFEWELIRECSAKNIQVIGGASKLFRAFVKGHDPLSVLVYTSKKDEHLFHAADHYQKHMGFDLLKASRSIKEQRYVSVNWPRDDGYGREYSASSVQHIGPDRLLGTSFGFESGSNSELMKKLGYSIESSATVSPQTDGWLKKTHTPHGPRAVGYLYRSDCSCGAKYFGMSERLDEKSVREYTGSGTRWLAHKKAHPDHRQEKAILRWLTEPKELRNEELRLIKSAKELYAGAIFNTKETTQGVPCESCGNFGRHASTCEKYRKPGALTPPCEECGGASSHHKRTCSLYVAPIRLNCLSCGAKSPGHKANCAARKAKSCAECGAGNLGAHRKSCSLYVASVGCLECGNKSGPHKSTCSRYTERAGCLECGSTTQHRASCSKNAKTGCAECGASGSAHRVTCSRRTVNVCQDCGKTSGPHRKGCSKYVQKTWCAECGASAAHFKACSKYRSGKSCAECGATGGKHRKGCSSYVDRTCKECGGYPGAHKLGCSKFKQRTLCSECGTLPHRLACSKRIKLSEQVL